MTEGRIKREMKKGSKRMDDEVEKMEGSKNRDEDGSFGKDGEERQRLGERETGRVWGRWGEGTGGRGRVV